MSSNLQEFLAIAMLVTSTTGLVGGFRYMIIVWESKAKEEIRRRQPELDALHAKYAAERAARQTDQAK